MKFKALVLSLTCCACLPAFADKMVSSNTGIVNLAAVLTSVHDQTSIPIVFPTKIPKNPTLNQLYAYADPMQVGKDSYTIDIDSTSTCHGAHYCNIGSFQVSTTGQPQQYKDINGHVITQTINLSTQQKAFYTPGHAMADYWPPSLEWRDANYFYRLVWQVRDRNALLSTAQSIQAYP